MANYDKKHFNIKKQQLKLLKSCIAVECWAQIMEVGGAAGSTKDALMKAMEKNYYGDNNPTKPIAITGR